MKEFLYFGPTTLKEATSLLSQYADGAVPLAGGTDLIRKMRKGTLQPQAVVCIKNIAEMKTLFFEPSSGLHIGGGATIREVEHFEAVHKYYPALIEVTRRFGTPQVRAVGTIAGNLCNASPAGDYAPLLLALGANLIITGSNGDREMPLTGFFAGKGQNTLQKDELLKEIIIPAPMKGERVGWERHTTREMLEVAIVGVAVWLRINNGICQAARVGLGSVAPVPIRGYHCEQALTGKPLTSESMQQAAEAVLEDIQPISDFRASADYRKDLVQVYLKRVLGKLSQ
jgi:carbon-monoxide dehydrogenase medium subunit